MSVNESLAGEGFDRGLAFGQAGESRIARWLMGRGVALLPVYDVEKENGKGPRVFSQWWRLIAPDLLVFSTGRLIWAEAKHKSRFTWYENGRRWQTGIDQRHWGDYLCVRDELGLPLWLLFLHELSTPSRDDIARGCEPECPTGLFGGDSSKLERLIDHKWPRHGPSSMVYWNAEDLRLLAPLEDVPA